MPQYCCVPHCQNRGGHTFPKDPDITMKWRVAINRVDTTTKRLWKPGKWDIVCAAHFVQNDYRDGSLLGERKILKSDAVPSVFLYYKVKSCSPTPREVRSLKRKKCENDEDIYNVRADYVVDDDIEVGANAEINFTDVTDDNSSSIQLEEISISDKDIQCNLISTANFSVENFKLNPTAIQFYTGFDDFDHLLYFFNILGPASYDLNYKCALLSPLNQLFLTLIKLRQAKEDIELSILFHLSETTVSRIITTWINFLYFQLKEINIWPSREIVSSTMPKSFKLRFPSTRVILDATETPIQKPSNVCAQSATFSTYKGRNTLKTMIGCSPRGLVTYVSESYGGATSDRQIIERSDLTLPGKMNKHDSIMADRGIMVQDLFANNDVFINTPTMLKGKSQLEPAEVVKDRRISSKRVHVERVIGLGKTYKILQRNLPHTKLILGSRIVYICFVLSNFRRSIVNNLA